jgi:hypothetical protein
VERNRIAGQNPPRVVALVEEEEEEEAEEEEVTKFLLHYTLLPLQYSCP